MMIVVPDLQVDIVETIEDPNVGLCQQMPGDHLQPTQIIKLHQEIRAEEGEYENDERNELQCLQPHPLHAQVQALFYLPLKSDENWATPSGVALTMVVQTRKSHHQEQENAENETATKNTNLGNPLEANIVGISMEKLPRKIGFRTEQAMWKLL